MFTDHNSISFGRGIVHTYSTYSACVPFIMQLYICVLKLCTSMTYSCIILFLICMQVAITLADWWPSEWYVCTYVGYFNYYIVYVFVALLDFCVDNGECHMSLVLSKFRIFGETELHHMSTVY